jgi:hypothetical protein
MANDDGDKSVYNIDIETKKTTTLKVTDDMIQQEILEDIENAKKKLINVEHRSCYYHGHDDSNLDYEKLTLQSFGDYENEINLNAENKLKLNYIMSPEYSIFHIFGFLQSIFGTVTAVWFYLKLKYDFNVIHNLECKLGIVPNISHLVISTWYDIYTFTEILYNLFKLFELDVSCTSEWPILQHLSEKEKTEISKKYHAFSMFIRKDGYQSKFPILDILEKHSEYNYYRDIQKVEVRLNDYFYLLDSLMKKFPDDYIQIVDRIKPQYDAKIIELRDKYSPLSKMGPASSSSKRQRED